ncbi:MAG TPA: biotin/lipoyl-containing protein, partial [Longimicrobium sp.]|nr:biotin/lipoyl-containing protein [Longimicrobium sp.]
MGDFRMPSLGADMAQGTLLEWRVRPGDAVRRGDVIAVVDTDKAAIEVEVWESGVVDELVVTEGTRVPVGAVLARLRPPGASAGGTEPPSIPGPSIPAAEPTGTPARAAERPAPAPAIVPSPVPPTRARTLPAAISVYRPDGRVRASPAARRLAASRGIDLAGVRGTGPDGAVGVADVER